MTVDEAMNKFCELADQLLDEGSPADALERLEEFEQRLQEEVNMRRSALQDDTKRGGWE